MRFDYTISDDQLAFLKSLSSKASQQVRVNCKQREDETEPNSALPGAKASSMGPDLIALLADDDTILDQHHPKRRFKVPETRCLSQVCLHLVLTVSVIA
ncbi:unnamed protein product [Protopolystoma xenopodis]|uniref:Fibrillar collagen NC1 domain-containing protein n=1 Tax=Protopolystoma xenopodis TaxID=117903 RepID=A0A448XHE9_9PLAT|nr:unnamed protein product [Protopolystoma xenopodis]